MPTIRTKTVLLAACLSSFLAACSGYKPPAPSPLQANPATTPVATRWSAKLAHELQFPLQIASQGEQVLVADGGGLRGRSGLGDEQPPALCTADHHPALAAAHVAVLDHRVPERDEVKVTGRLK